MSVGFLRIAMQCLRQLSEQCCTLPGLSQIKLGSKMTSPVRSQLTLGSLECLLGVRCISNTLALLAKYKVEDPMSHRPTLPCGTYCNNLKPCFDISKVFLQRGRPCHKKMVRSFLYSHYWPREPSACALWLPIDCDLISKLTEKYCSSGDHYLAFENEERTGERRLIGVVVGYPTYPWTIDELINEASRLDHKNEQALLFFMAHCLSSPNLFKKYQVNYLYNLEVLATTHEVGRQGVGRALIQYALDEAIGVRHPITQLVATSSFAAKIANKCKMEEEWTMDYTEFIDSKGNSLFFPRKPHCTVKIFTNKFVSNCT